MTQMNVFRQPIKECSCAPLTGFFRDGTCSTDSEEDLGNHLVCCEMNEEFLAYSKYTGNDLSTPRPEFGFDGLKPGDHWCVCLDRWKQAFDDGCAPKVDLAATHLGALELVSLDQLKKHAIASPQDRH